MTPSGRNDESLDLDIVGGRYLDVFKRQSNFTRAGNIYE
jgi:hypothetical protein